MLSDDSVLVTGGAGFIGSALVNQLLANDNDVVVLDNLNNGCRSYLPSSNRLTLIEDDVRDADIPSIIKTHCIEYVFHLAADPFIPISYSSPRHVFSVNTQGTLNVLLGCREADVTRIVYYSSSEVYGTAKHLPIDEEHPLSPQSTYAVSKAAGDRLCYTFYHEHNLPVIMLRQFNCYGPRETHPYLIPEIITQLSSSPHVTLGNIEASRDFTYVDDAVIAAIKLICCEEVTGEAVNIGSGKQYSVRELVDIIGSLMGHDTVTINQDPKRLRPNDIDALECDYAKAEELVGYTPATGIRDGLQKTISWHHQHGWLWE